METFAQNNGSNTRFDRLLDKVVSHACVIGGKTVCPCKNCRCGETVTKEVAMEHLKSVGFSEELMKLMVYWDSLPSQSKTLCNNAMASEECGKEGYGGSVNLPIDRERVVDMGGGKKYKKRLADFMVQLLSLKQRDDLADESVTELLELCNDFLPEGEEVAKSYSELLQVVGEEGGDDTNTPMDDKRSGQTASTSFGEVVYSSKEEKRKKLREKINQRKESRVSKYQAGRQMERFY